MLRTTEPMPDSEAPSSYRTYQVGDRTVSVSLQEPAPDTTHVPEALVQDLWRHQRFDTDGLSTTEGETVRVLDPGRLNTDAGPDFHNAHVRIGGMDWRGHVEVHTTSGGWFDHEHHSNPRYDSVILHVTLRPDMWTGGLLRPDQSPLPEVVLYPRLEAPLRKLLHSFRTRPDEDSLPCASRWDEVPSDHRQRWIRHLAQERLAGKRDRLARRSAPSLESLLYERLFAGLGYAKNDEPMTTLAQRVPLEVLRSVQGARNREALLLGVADLLPEPGDLLETDRATADHAMDLQDRFRRLQVQIDAPRMEATSWTFFRLRPNNFPPLRVAQGAAWFADDALLASAPLPRLRSALAQEEPVPALRAALRAVPSPFWRTHYHLTKASSEHDPSLGTSRRTTLLVNAVVPVLLLDADRRDDSAQKESALKVLQALPAEQDHVVLRFQELGTDVDSAFTAQGLHQLYRSYCTAGGCLNCDIGQYLLEA